MISRAVDRPLGSAPTQYSGFVQRVLLSLQRSLPMFHAEALSHPFELLSIQAALGQLLKMALD
jgi:hypothetical protein